MHGVHSTLRNFNAHVTRLCPLEFAIAEPRILDRNLIQTKAAFGVLDAVTNRPVVSPLEVFYEFCFPHEYQPVTGVEVVHGDHREPQNCGEQAEDEEGDRVRDSVEHLNLLIKWPKLAG